MKVCPDCCFEEIRRMCSSVEGSGKKHKRRDDEGDRCGSSVGDSNRSTEYDMIDCNDTASITYSSRSSDGSSNIRHSPSRGKSSSSPSRQDSSNNYGRRNNRRRGDRDEQHHTSQQTTDTEDTNTNKSERYYIDYNGNKRCCSRTVSEDVFPLGVNTTIVMDRHGVRLKGGGRRNQESKRRSKSAPRLSIPSLQVNLNEEKKTCSWSNGDETVPQSTMGTKVEQLVYRTTECDNNLKIRGLDLTRFICSEVIF